MDATVTQRGRNKAKYEKRVTIADFKSRIIAQLKIFRAVSNPQLFPESVGHFVWQEESICGICPCLFNILLSMETFGLASWRTAGSHRWRDRGILPLRLINNFQIQNISLNSSKCTHVVKLRADSQNHTWAMWTTQKVKQSGSDWLIG